MVEICCFILWYLKSYWCGLVNLEVIPNTNKLYLFLVECCTWVCSKKVVEQLGIRCNLDRMFISPFFWWVGTYKSLESLTRCLQLHLSGFSLETQQPLHALPLSRALPVTAKET